MGVKIAGIEATIKKKLSDKTAVEDADRIAQGTMMRIGTDAANNAPVDTGLLQRTMTTGIQRSDSKPKGAWDMLQKTDYTIIQEFVAYPSQSPEETGFIRNAVEIEEPRFVDALTQRFAKKRGR